MIILRQKNYSKVKKSKENLNYAWDHGYGGHSKLAKNGVVINNVDENLSDFLNTALFESHKKTNKVHRHNGYLIYPTLRYDSESKVPKIYGSSPKTSYKDSYKGFLKNERALNEHGGYSSERFNNNHLPGPSNKDIKNDIRKLAKKEAIKKCGSIGLASTAVLGTGAYLLHKYNKKKKKEQEKKEDK